jgi:hypothetical protein
VWFDDWELGNYSRWTSQGYVSNINQGGCYTERITTERAHSGTRSHLSAVGCTSADSHRIYGGIQFSGDTVLSGYTNTGSGIDAPNGLVITYWSWLEAPNGFDYDGRWFSFMTANNTCDWSDNVLGFGLEDPTHRWVPAWVTSTGGSVTYAPTRAPFPFGRWVRTTVYLNYYTGVMRSWQDGAEQFTANFRRNSNRICHFHWGLYAGAVISSLTLFEDDFSIHKLDQPATFTSEPWMGQTQPVCP